MINHNTDSKKRLWVLGGHDASYSSHQNEYSMQAGKDNKYSPNNSSAKWVKKQSSFTALENPKKITKPTRKPEKNHKKSLFKVFVNFQPLRKKEKKQER